MKREIKFRGRRTGNGEWVYGYYFKDMAEGRAYHAIGETPLLAHEIDPETVGQFTGLHDMAGVGIYEGDLLNNEFGGIWAVRFNKDGFWECYDYSNAGYYLSDYLKSSEIIGTIHDNPELLNTK